MSIAQRSTNQAKDIEILLFRQRLRILQRKAPSTKITPLHKLNLAVVLTKFKELTGQTNQQLRAVILLVRPETVLRWHRELIHRTWAFDALFTSEGIEHFFNAAQQHQGIVQRIPRLLPESSTGGKVKRCDQLGGVLHEYYRAA